MATARPPLVDAIAAALVVAACLLVVWPGPLAAGALGHPTSDMPYHLWGTWWFQGELLAGRLPTQTAITHLPGGGALWHADPVGALLSLPLAGLAPALRWNLLLTAQVLGAGLAGFGLGRALGGAWGGLAAGLICGASPYAVSLLYSGISEYLGLAWPVLFVWALHRALHGPGRVWVAGLALAACALQAFYYGAFACLLALCAVPGPGWRARLRPALGVIALGLALSAGPLALAVWTLRSPDAAFTPEQAPGWTYATLPVTDLSSWLRWGDWYYPNTPALGNPGILHVNAVGWAVLALAALGAAGGGAGRALGLCAALYGLFALGPALSWNGQPVEVAGTPVPLPLALAYLVPGSPWGMVHHPYRMVALLTPLLGALAALGVGRLRPPLRVLALGAVLFEALGLSPAPWPVPVSPLRPDPIYAALPGPGAVLDWPPDMSTANRRYLLEQLHHGRGVATGVTIFLHERVRQDPLGHALLRALEDPTRRARDRDVPARGRVVLPPRPGPGALGGLGFSWLVLHDEELSPRELSRAQALLTRALGPPVVEVEGDGAWGLEP